MFNDIIGHDAVKRVLTLAVDRPHGAYLIVGQDGLGAHLLAERFVRALVGLGESASLSAHPDVAVLARETSTDEKTAKTVISVEAVRELRERMSRRPIVASRVVAYVPEADRLNEAGVNALLKSMEEPAAGAVFVLVAHDESRLPATLKSRTARLVLSRVASKEIDAWLHQRGVADTERRMALEVAEGRPGVALRWVEDPDVRASYQESAHVVERLLSSRTAGDAFAAIDAVARQCDAADDAQSAWQDAVARLASSLRLTFSHDATRALHLGHVLANVQRHQGGPISPRIWFELGLVRFTSDRPPVFPTHIPSLSLSSL